MKEDNIVTVTVPSEIKEEAQVVLDNLGISMSTAVSVYLRQIVLQNDIPFEVKIPKSLDSISQKEFASVIKQSLEDVKENKGIPISEAREILNQEK